MVDTYYVVGTIAFFVAMLAYLRGCETLGRHTGAEVSVDER